MEISYLESLKPIIAIILAPVFVLVLRIFFPLKSVNIIEFVNEEEGKKMENKRNIGCLFNIILITIILGCIGDFLWKPIFYWINTFPKAVFVVKITKADYFVLSLSAAFAICIISTNYWFIQKYGNDQFSRLQSYYSAKYNFNNPKAEMLMFYAALFVFLFICAVFYTKLTYITEDEYCYREELSLTIIKKPIKDIERIEFIQKEINNKGEFIGFPKYRVFFKDGTNKFSEDVRDDGFWDSNQQPHEIFKFLSEKSGKPIIIIPLLQF